MIGYMANFGVYTMAMIGILVVALLVYKKSTNVTFGHQGGLKIDERIALNARKSLYVVNAGGERFLIAGDMDNTSLIAKLGVNDTVSSVRDFAAEKEVALEKSSYMSKDVSMDKVAEFKKELEAKKALEKSFAAFENNATQKTVVTSTPSTSSEFERRLDIKSIRKKPVMKELARKLAQV